DTHRPVVESIRPELEGWAQEFLIRPRCGASFAAFLEQPAAVGLVADGLTWLDEAVSRQGPGYFLDQNIEHSLTSFLDTCWSAHGPKVKSNEGAFKSLRSLLRILADKQNSVATELLHRIAETC
ncbi:hypothetical protein ACFL2Q_19975, partial [Thermodesulfobacteriota bacterium]